jgi:hypothetical protein
MVRGTLRMMKGHPVGVVAVSSCGEYHGRC